MVDERGGNNMRQKKEEVNRENQRDYQYRRLELPLFNGEETLD